MKRFLKVILILAAVFGVAGLGLTAGGAAMGATMGDVSVLDHGITQVLRVLDHEDSWEVEDSLLYLARTHTAGLSSVCSRSQP